MPIKSKIIISSGIIGSTKTNDTVEYNLVDHLTLKEHLSKVKNRLDVNEI